MLEDLKRKKKCNHMEQKRNSFLDGFVLGAVVAGAAVFLLGTKKGREVLNIVKEEGEARFGKFGSILHEYQEAMGDDEEFEEAIEEGIKTVKKEEKAKSPARRKLFKGLSKKK